MIRSEHMKSCLAAQKRCLMFKELGSFKKMFKIGRKCRGFTGLSIDTTPPPPSLVILQYLRDNNFFLKIYV
jgi:hypothetical protein